MALRCLVPAPAGQSARQLAGRCVGHPKGERATAAAVLEAHYSHHTRALVHQTGRQLLPSRHLCAGEHKVVENNTALAVVFVSFALMKPLAGS